AGRDNSVVIIVIAPQYCGTIAPPRKTVIPTSTYGRDALQVGRGGPIRIAPNNDVRDGGRCISGNRNACKSREQTVFKSPYFGMEEIHNRRTVLKESPLSD